MPTSTLPLWASVAIAGYTFILVLAVIAFGRMRHTARQLDESHLDDDAFDTFEDVGVDIRKLMP